MPGKFASSPKWEPNKILCFVTVDVRPQACGTWCAQHNVRNKKHNGTLDYTIVTWRRQPAKPIVTWAEGTQLSSVLDCNLYPYYCTLCMVRGHLTHDFLREPASPTTLCLGVGCLPCMCKNTLRRRGWSSRLGEIPPQTSSEPRPKTHVFPTNTKKITLGKVVSVPNGIQYN